MTRNLADVCLLLCYAVMSDRRTKRKHGGPTGNTFGKPSNKTPRCGSSGKVLLDNAPVSVTFSHLS